MKIKKGMYVRTQKNEIKKIYKCCGKDIGYKNMNYYIPENGSFIYEEDIAKASHNIIDLIEVGDYVNGKKVYQVGYNFQDDFVLKMSKSNYENFIYPKDIKSIVTKEQFEQMKYVVE